MTTGTLLDANLLCLLVVGRYDKAAIGSHPRLRAFDQGDFHKLVAIIDRFGDPIVCPHVLAETSNLLNFRQAPSQQARWLASLADIVAKCAEHSKKAIDAIADRAYSRLGLADAVLLLLAIERGWLLVSDDLQLCLEAERRGLKTLNYNYVRDGAVRIDQL